jgi:hypothetical protein
VPIRVGEEDGGGGHPAVDHRLVAHFATKAARRDTRRPQLRRCSEHFIQ